MKLLRISAENFLSYGNIDIDLSKAEDLLLLEGENQDEGGTDSNGSGKTNFVNIPSCALLKKVSGKLTATELLRDLPGGGQADKGFTQIIGLMNNHSEILVRRELGKRYSDKERGFKSEGDKLHFFIDGKDFSRRKDEDTQVALLDYLGLPLTVKEAYEDYRNRVHIAREGVAAFMDQETGPTARMALVSRAARLEEVEEAGARARDDADGIEEELRLLEGSIAFNTPEGYDEALIPTLQKNLKTFEEEKEEINEKLEKVIENASILQSKSATLERLRSVERERETLKENHNSRMERLRDRFSSLSEKIKHTEEELDELEQKEKPQSKADELAQELSSSTQKEEKCRTLHEQKKKELREEKEKLSDLESQGKVEKFKCPECGAVLIMEESGLVTFDEAALKRLSEKLTKSVKELSNQATSLYDKYCKASERKLTISDEANKDRKKSSEYERVLADIKAKETWLDEIEADLKDLEQEGRDAKMEGDSKVKSLDSEIARLKGEADQTVVKKLESLNKEKESLTLSRKNAEQAVIDSKLKLEQFEKAKKTLANFAEDKKPLLKKLKALDFWKQGFPVIRRWKMDAFLPRLEESCNNFLRKMEVTQRVGFGTLKTLKSQKTLLGSPVTKAGFEVTLRDGIGSSTIEKPIKKANTGHRQRLALASALALRELAQSKFEFLFIDEVVDVLDETGMNLLFSVLQKEGGQVFVITHRKAPSIARSITIRVIRRDNTSTAHLP